MQKPQEVNYHLTVPAFRQFWHGMNEYHLKVHFHRIFDLAFVTVSHFSKLIAQCQRILQCIFHIHSRVLLALVCTLKHFRHLCSKGVCCPGCMVLLSEGLQFVAMLLFWPFQRRIKDMLTDVGYHPSPAFSALS